jgi:hypothetical protein
MVILNEKRIIEFMEKKNKFKHCCKKIYYHLKYKNYSIWFSLIVREYSLIKKYAIPLAIQYCPWCGKELPKNLLKKYYEILEKEYNIEFPHQEENKSNFPEEFKTDLWWKKRNL